MYKSTTPWLKAMGRVPRFFVKKGGATAIAPGGGMEPWLLWE